VNRLREVFDRYRVVPVVHVQSAEQAVRNAGVAMRAGAEGVFLINHGLSDKALLHIQQQVLTAFPHWWVGVNCLRSRPERVFRAVSPGVPGVWVDSAMIREDREFQPVAERVLAIRRQRRWPGLYFGGVAFKYQAPVRDPAAAARLGSRYIDVVTTSGPGTGHAPHPDKIRCMKEALGEAPLAIASGITPENVGDYLPWADCYLVATGISRSFEDFEPERVSALVEKIHAFSPQKNGAA
jgi:2-keto-3-deoxy-6-phosphogluconate aldolase